MTTREPLAQLMLAAFLLLGVLATGASAKNRALLIGVGTYANLSADLFLKGPQNDVQLIKHLLQAKMGYQPDDIKILSDKGATKQAIEDAFRSWLIEGTSEGDKVYFYFSGHGIQVRDLDGDESDQTDEALAPYDLKIGEDDFLNAITDDEIAKLLNDLKGRAVTVVVDACHSGTITRSLTRRQPPAGARYLVHQNQKIKNPPAATRALSFEPKTLDKPQGIISLSAAAPHQLAFDDLRKKDDGRTGVFTGAYVAGILGGDADKNKNGSVSFSELLAHLRKESDIYCKQDPSCQALTPVMEVPEEALKYSVAPTSPTFTTAKPKKPASELELNPKVTQFTAYTLEDLKENHTKPDNGYEVVTEVLADPSYNTLSLEIKPGAVLAEGQAFTVHVTSGVSGDLLLYDLDTKGKALQLFPNELSGKSTRISSGQPFFMPDDDYGFDFEAGKPGGYILAIVINDRLALDAFAPKALGLTDYQDTAKLLGMIGKQLSDYVVDGQGDDVTARPVHWAYGLIRYEVN